MIQTDALVTAVEQHGPFTQIVFASATIAAGLASGRFVLADIDGYLRTRLFPSRIDATSFDILVPPDHPAAALWPETRVNLIGPLGRGFEPPATASRLLLVADTPHLPALLPLTQARNQASSPRLRDKPDLSPSTALLLSAPTATELYPMRLLPPALEVHLATADGSAGHHGSALDLFPDLVRWADCVCVAGDPASYSALAEVVRQVRIRPDRHFGQALVAPPVVCGVGACQCCGVEVARGIKLACTDGPVFDLLELR